MVTVCANCDGDCSAEVKGHETSLPRIISSLTPPESGTNGDENHNGDNTFQPDDACDEHQQHRQRHLVLHFDINETILVCDPAGDDTREDTLNKMLAKSAFVQIAPGHSNYEETSSTEPTHWWNGAPIANNSNGKKGKVNIYDNPPPLYTGWSWPDNCCPYYRTKLKKRAKTFIDHDGHCYKNLYNEVDRRLKHDVSDHHNCNHHKIWEHMIPAFFETIIELCKRKNQPFTLVFRTMGTDLADIAAALSAFALGKHPRYPDFYQPQLVLPVERLVQGRWRRDDDDDTCTFQLWQNGKVIATGDEQVLEFIYSHPVCGIQDDYLFWKQNNWEPFAGKPVWMDDNGSSGNHHHQRRLHYHHLIFDDNIHNLPHDGIVSVRRRRNNGSSVDHFDSLSGSEILEQHGRHLIRVPTIEPVMNSNWFVQQIDEALRKT